MRTNINDSLNLLKQLEVRLKRQHPPPAQPNSLKPQPPQTPAKKPWGQRLTSAYEQAEEELKHENKQLKRYVNKLVRMNDYLKNQLVQGEHFGRKDLERSQKQEREIKMLRVEVEYLKELNREKELEIEFLRQKERGRKRSLFTELTQESYSSHQKLNTNNTHKRQISAKLSNSKKALNYSVRPSSSKTKVKCKLCYE